MDFCLQAIELPIRLLPDIPMSDESLLRFCAANETLRVERQCNGEIHIKTPAGTNAARKNAFLTQALGVWTDSDGRGYAFDSNAGYTLPDSSMRSPDAPG